MAKVQFGTIVTALRGKLGGQVFSINTSGSNLGQHTKTTAKKAGPKKRAQNAIIGGGARNWRQLSEGNRQSFIDAAPSYPRQNSLGQTYYLTGSQLYNAWNANRTKTGAGQLNGFNDPNLDGNNVGLLVVNEIQVDLPTVITIDADYTGDADNVQVAIYVSRPVSPGKSSLSNQYKLFKVIAVGDIGDPINSSEYIALFPGAAAGLKTFFKIDLVNSVSGFGVISAENMGVILAAAIP